MKPVDGSPTGQSLRNRHLKVEQLRFGKETANCVARMLCQPGLASVR
jgi:hypothetical protein